MDGRRTRKEEAQGQLRRSIHADLTRPVNGLVPLEDKEGILEVRGVNVAYWKTQVLYDVYCHFPKNTVTAIMGPSGCGKSTLVKVLNRTLELTPGASVSSGMVLYHGKDLYGRNHNSMNVRKRIGIIHQQPVPFPMSVRENVLFGAKFHHLYNKKAKSEYVTHYLEKVGLWEEVKDRLGQNATNLSGGQQQRLCLARALANQPDVILMDEPCSALDPAATQRIEELIRQLCEDYTVIIVTHNMSQAQRVSEYAVFIFEGRVIEAGRTDEIFSQPKTDLARAFITGAIG